MILRRILFPAYISFALTLTYPLRMASAEPLYQGRTLHQWLALGLPKSPFFHRYLLPRDGQIAVKEIGTNAIPILIEMLKSENNQTNNYRALEERNMATMAFEILGKSASAATSQLVILTRNPNELIRNAALQSLMDTEPNKETLKPILLERIHDVDGNVRFLATAGLHYVSPQDLQASGIADPLVEALRAGK